MTGAWTLFHIIWNVAGQTADDYWGIALLILFVLALIIAFTQFFAEHPALKAPPPQSSFLNRPSRGSSCSWLTLETGNRLPTTGRTAAGRIGHHSFDGITSGSQATGSVAHLE